jgi:hypothetical protein
MPAHAVTVAVEARQSAEGLRQAGRSDGLAIPSQPRRGRHLIEVARAYHRGGNGTAALGALGTAYRTAPETIRYNGYARSIVAELASTGHGRLRRDAADLAERIAAA